jgi:hypothetical protein
MQLRVARQRQVSYDRKGRPDARFTLSMQLEANEDERRAITENNLSSYFVYEAPALMLTVEDLLQGIEKTLNNVELLLSVESAVLDNCKKFGALLTAASTYDGTRVAQL